MSTLERPPKCHFKEMNYECGDDGSEPVEWWECKHCGHTKSIDGKEIPK